jgi:predicted nucleic acid-binding Zn ribbon protein
MNDAEKCVVCGAVIPEGKQVCPKCENYTEAEILKTGGKFKNERIEQAILPKD